MRVITVSGPLSPFRGNETDLERLRAEVERLCTKNGIPLRLAVAKIDADRWDCEVECARVEAGDHPPPIPSIFSFRRRGAERTNSFNVVMLIPTGIDCAIGGHAGDATPAARLLASVCDNLVLHPNVVNASDINEQTENSLYVEGSLICRLLMGDISLRKVRSNRIFVVTEARSDGPWTVDQVMNTANAARATLGVNCTKVAVLQNGLSLQMRRSPSGRSTGEIGAIEDLFTLLRSERDNFDAVALSTKITPFMDMTEMFQSYFQGEGPNPWGGVEAALTHVVSMAFDVPSAHAPTMEDLNLRNHSYGCVDPRKAGEAISTSYTFCLLKGLHRAPAVVTNPDGVYDPSVVAAEDISCLVVPDGSVGLPVLAALLQSIPVIAVRNNTNLMRSDLQKLPFAPGKLWFVENYLEAAGLISAFKAGITPASVTRPLPCTPVVTV